MPSVAGVIWAVAVWDGAKSPISHIVKAVNERNARKKRGFLCVDFMVLLVDDISYTLIIAKVRQRPLTVPKSVNPPGNEFPG